ncbi:MAG: hypothetical protein IT353_13835 [Gemmatimonadaceae bacterium]|nr:hypothetical protein [Gemmatimonadaceae bacterium]
MKSKLAMFLLTAPLFFASTSCQSTKRVESEMFKEFLNAHGISDVIELTRLPQSEDDAGRKGVTLDILNHPTSTQFGGCVANMSYIELRMTDGVWREEDFNQSIRVSALPCDRSRPADYFHIVGDVNAPALVQAMQDVRAIVLEGKRTLHPRYQDGAVESAFLSASKPSFFVIDVSSADVVRFQLLQDDFLPKVLKVDYRRIGSSEADIYVYSDSEVEGVK